MKNTRVNSLLKVIPLAAITLSLVQCAKETGPSFPKRSYELVWSDEFNGSAGSAVDPSKWTYDLGTGSNGWGNNELQSYTDKPENVSLDGEGNLVITAIKGPGSSYSSARIKTEGLFTQQYGRVEARIKTPAGQGLWPAFWMLGENINEVSWPQCGEIDIMEQKGQYPFITYGSLHGPGYSAGNAITKSYRLETGTFQDTFFLYAVEWGPEYIDFFVNDNLYQSVRASSVSGEWVYNQPFFLILNLAVGGTFPGAPNDKTSFPAQMLVDYVRVYKEK